MSLQLCCLLENCSGMYGKDMFKFWVFHCQTAMSYQRIEMLRFEHTFYRTLLWKINIEIT